jgi:hypothetical protein
MWLVLGKGILSWDSVFLWRSELFVCMNDDVHMWI